VQAAIPWVDALARPKFTAAVPFVDLGACFSFLTGRSTGKPLNAAKLSRGDLGNQVVVSLPSTRLAVRTAALCPSGAVAL